MAAPEYLCMCVCVCVSVCIFCGQSAQHNVHYGGQSFSRSTLVWQGFVVLLQIAKNQSCDFYLSGSKLSIVVITWCNITIEDNICYLACPTQFCPVLYKIHIPPGCFNLFVLFLKMLCFLLWLSRLHH